MSPIRAAALVLVVVAIACALSSSRPRAAMPLPPLPPRRTELNRAGSEELEALPGIGPDRARRIVRLRRERRGFRSVEELLDVPGVGAKTLEALRPHLTLGPSP